MIKYAMKQLKLNIMFLDITGDNAYCGVHGHETIENVIKDKDITQKMVLVAWVHKTHFEPIVRIDDVSEGKITGVFNPHNKKDKAFIGDFVANYMQGCKIKSP
jgi:hypothetical protein